MSHGVRELAARVIERIGDPVDRWAVAVAIESAELAAAPASATSPPASFALADAVFAECLERRRQRPEVTVAMPAYNRAALIGDAIRSVLAQEDIAFELIVVDDGSDDDTAAVAESFADPRIVVVRNASNRGIAHCHNLIVARSRAPFIAHVDSDDIIMPGALRKVVDRVAASSDYGQAHGLYAFVDADGSVERDELRRQRRVLVERADLDYRQALLRHGSVMNHLRVYRREIFDVTGGFNESLRHGEDLEMALRVLQTHEIVAVPELVYCVRRHRGRRTSLRLARLRFWAERVVMVGSLLRRGAISYPRTARYRASKWLLRDLGGALGIEPLARGARELLGRWKAGILRRCRRAARATGAAVYRSVVRALARWPAPRRRVATAEHDSAPRVVYCLWQYPIASQTFIRRELAALSRLGVPVVVAVEDRGGDRAESLDGAPPPLRLGDVERDRVVGLMLRRLIGRPWSLVSLGCWVVGRRYGPIKSWREDLVVLGRAARLAAALEREGATQVHAPWADRSALVARLAAAIQRIPYSTQGRAYELQRERARIGLHDRLSGAAFVVCGARYTRDRLRELLGSTRVPIHVVQEGVEPARFEPPARAPAAGAPMRVLTVARLIEEKGIVHLLAAGAELRRRGVAVTWRVVGGADEPASTNYLLEVRRLHRRLGLGDFVRFTGSLPFEQVVAEYGGADLFVLPCVEAANGGRDVTPNVILEAMAMELPVVSSRQTAIPELAPDGECAILVEPGDVGAIADAVASLAANDDLRRALGSRGRARVASLFDVDRNAAQLARLLAGEPCAEAG